METEIIDKLFLELSQFSHATTAREMHLSRELSKAQTELAKLRADAERWRKVVRLLDQWEQTPLIAMRNYILIDGVLDVREDTP